MPLGVSVKVDTGGITVALNELQSRNATLRAVRAGIKVVQAAAKAAAPKRYGPLRASQGVKAVKGRKGRTGSFAVQGAKTAYRKTRKGKNIRPAFYDHLVIGGVKPHGVKKGGGSVRKVHPGARSNPYRARAYVSVQGQVKAVVIQVMGIEVQKIIAKASAAVLGKLSGSRK